MTWPGLPDLPLIDDDLCYKNHKYHKGYIYEFDISLHSCGLDSITTKSFNHSHNSQDKGIDTGKT